MTDYKLIHQDCIEWMESQKKGSVDCIVTSPPYNLDIKYGKYQDDLPRDSYLKWMNDYNVHQFTEQRFKKHTIKNKLRQIQ